MDRFPYALGDDQLLAYKLFRAGHDLLVHYDTGIIHLDAGSGHIKDPVQSDLDNKCIRYLIWYRSLFQPANCNKRPIVIVAFYARWFFQLLLSFISSLNGHSYRMTNCFKSLKEAKEFIRSSEFSNIPKWEVKR